MKRFNLKRIFTIILVLCLFCYLKKGNIPFDNSIPGIYNIIILWSDSVLINIVWLLPIMFTFYMIGKKFFFNLLSFDMRYKNRKKYFRKNVVYFITNSILFNSFVFFFQLIALLYINGYFICMNTSLLVFLLQYIVEMTFATLLIVLTGLLLKNFIYSYLIYITFFLLGIIILKPNQYIPFFSLYNSININFFSSFGIVILILIIKKMYKHYDIGGIEL